MKALILLLLIGAIAIFWFEGLRVRERVIARCREICQRSGLQFLDETVALVSISLKRKPDGNPTIFRIYQFEVSESGADRRRGYVAVTGRDIHHIRLEGKEGETILYHRDVQQVH